MATILATHELKKNFGGFIAVDDIDLTINKGEIRCIIGPNGAGKSTFLRLVVGFFPATAGSVEFDGDDISHLHCVKRVNRGMGIKFQIPRVFPAMSTSENLAIALQRTTPPDKLDSELDRLLELIDLGDQRNTVAANLSHGQQQWLDIGMAMSTHPKLLLLDEPTAGMSPNETYHTGELVMNLNSQGTTVITVEHDMDFVRQIAHKVTVMHHGKIFCEGSIGEIESNDEVARIYLGNA